MNASGSQRAMGASGHGDAMGASGSGFSTLSRGLFIQGVVETHRELKRVLLETRGRIV